MKQSDFAAHLAMAECISKMFYPYVEAVVHNLQTGKIEAIYGGLSRRKAGDPSAFSELRVETIGFPDIFEPYYKTNWDGKKLKSTSLTIRDSQGGPIGLLCINFDTSAFQTMGDQLAALLAVSDKQRPNPIEQFTENWQQQVSSFIDEYMRVRQIILKNMTKEQKRDLVNELYKHGLFHYRKATAYVAELLHTSRATIYNYLKEDSQ